MLSIQRVKPYLYGLGTTLPPHYPNQGNFLLIYFQNSTILSQEDRKPVSGGNFWLAKPKQFLSQNV